MAAYRRFMTHVTCRLTDKNRDQLRNPTLGNRVSATEMELVTPVDPVTLFYNELQMSTCVKKYSEAKEFLIIIGKSKSSLHGLTSSDFSPTTDT